MQAATPVEEAERIAALLSYAVLDTEPELPFERITSLASRLFGVPIALVSLVDANRQWFKSCVGLDTRETPRDVAFCAHAILHDEPLVIDDALARSSLRRQPAGHRRATHSLLRRRAADHQARLSPRHAVHSG